MAKDKLLPMQRKAVDWYFRNGFNKKDAMIRAGYAETTATGNARSVFSHPAVVAEVERRFEAMKKKYELGEDWIIQRLMRIADGGERLAMFKKINEDGTLSWDFSDATPDDLAIITELTTDTYVEGRGDEAKTVKKFKVAISDPGAALERLMRHMGMFKDKVEVAGEINLVERLQRGRERAGK